MGSAYCASRWGGVDVVVMVSEGGGECEAEAEAGEVDWKAMSNFNLVSRIEAQHN